jgi:hypothetical protein
MNKIEEACVKHWDAHKDNCSGFVRAVATELGLAVEGDANGIVDAMAQTPWKSLTSGAEAKTQAELGYFVLGGLKAAGHGHIVVVTPGPLNREKYPTAYWGRLGGEGRQATTINWSWNASDRDKVVYAYHTTLP